MSEKVYSSDDLLAVHDQLEELMEGARSLAAVSDGDERTKLEQLARQYSGLCSKSLEDAFKLTSSQLGEAVRQMTIAQELIAAAEADVERTVEAIEVLGEVAKTIGGFMQK